MANDELSKTFIKKEFQGQVMIRSNLLEGRQG